MNVRFFCLTAALWLAACGISGSADFGPGPTPSGNAGDGGKGGAGGTGGTPRGGQGGAAIGGKGGAAAGSAGAPSTSGTANPSGGNPAGAGAAGDEAGGSAGEPTTTPQPVCGNGIIEAGEECDASSASDHDGCDAECQVMCAEHGDDVLESSDHHCYAGSGNREAEFEASRQDCESRGAHLATIGSAAENELVLEFIVESKYVGGLEDAPITSEGTGDYRWITGEPLSFKNWGQGEPDRAESRCGQSGPGPLPSIMRCYEHCMAILADGSWVDQRCDRVDGYVCEWEPVGSK